MADFWLATRRRKPSGRFDNLPLSCRGAERAAVQRVIIETYFLILPPSVVVDALAWPCKGRLRNGYQCVFGHLFMVYTVFSYGWAGLYHGFLFSVSCTAMR